MKRTREVGASGNNLIFKLLNAEGAGRCCHDNFREQIKDWVHSHGWSETKSRQIWIATWEAVQNAMKHGSHRGDLIRIAVSTDGPQGVRVEVSQPDAWLDWRDVFGDIKRAVDSTPNEVHLGGAVTMYKLTSELNVSGNDRIVELHFRE